jgi:hypothetical protein
MQPVVEGGERLGTLVGIPEPFPRGALLPEACLVTNFGEWSCAITSD